MNYIDWYNEARRPAAQHHPEEHDPAYYNSLTGPPPGDAAHKKAA